MGTSTHTHNGHGVQFGHTHYKYRHYAISLFIVHTSKIGVSNMETPIINVSIMGARKVRVSIVDTIIKGKPIESVSDLGGG